jgi:ubiquitin fusion degradation protein 1
MLFKLSNKKQNRTTHCGVLEFVADEGKIYIPYWMMQNLMLDEGGLIQVLLHACRRQEPQNLTEGFS